MNTSLGVRTLARHDPTDTRGLPGSRTPGPVPRPKGRWFTRAMVPGVILVGAAGLLAYTARDMVRPAIAVTVVPVVPRFAPIPGAGDEDAPHQADHVPRAVNGVALQGALLAQAPGWVEPAPYATSIAALAEGVVSEVLALEGERVEAGQVVVRLVRQDAALSVRMAEAALRVEQAMLAGARSAVDTARAMTHVEWSNAEEVRDDLERKKELVPTGAVAAGDVRRLEIRLAGLEARARAAEQMVVEAQAAVMRAHAAVDAAQASLEEASLRLSRMEIVAPAAGVVLSRSVEPGTRIMINTESPETSGMAGVVMRVYDPLHLQVRVDVPLADAAKITLGTPATITTEALPDAVFHGVVTRAVHEANIQRNTVQFKVSLSEPSPVLKPEMLTRVRLMSKADQRLSGGTPSTAAFDTGEGLHLLVPARLIDPAAPGAVTGHLWLVERSPGGTVARRAAVDFVQTENPGYVRITRGIRPTDRVISDPPSTLREGARVRIAGEAMIPEATE
ncbi:MAG: efflux RND transporter periplasmic adaptor subunit [Phycisphaeraceae bacterium]|nr:efflux RND transporter periplasmic adaptor subunit [Phycisphaeraceae bacterium]